MSIALITDASTLHLNGTQQMTALMPEDSRTQAEEIVIRFKTARPRGLLLATSLENSADRLQIYLEEGKAQMQIRISDQEKVRRQEPLIQDLRANCELRHEFLSEFQISILPPSRPSHQAISTRARGRRDEVGECRRAVVEKRRY